MFRPLGFSAKGGSASGGRIWNLFGIWCLGFVNFSNRLHFIIPDLSYAIQDAEYNLKPDKYTKPIIPNCKKMSTAKISFY
jgi:hypothetical protein